MSKDQFQTAITADMTAKQVDFAISQSTAKHGRRGGMVQRYKIKEGWIVAIIYSYGNGYEHWNYHPGRTELALTHTTPRGISVIDALDASIAALERLYPQT